MSGYLQRALSRGFGVVEASNALRPFVRSTSPIADMDQRIGLPNFDPLGASLVPQPQEVDGPGEGLDRPVPPGDPSSPTALERRASVFQAASRQVASDESGPEAAAAGPRLEGPAAATSERSTAGPVITGPIDAGAQQPSRGPLASARQEGRSPSVTDEPLRSPRNTPVPGLARDVLPQTPVLPQAPGEGTSDPVPGDGYAAPGRPGPSGALSPDKAAGADRDAVHSSEYRSPPDNPILPKPLAALGHAPPVPMFRQVEDGPGTRTAAAPRVVIGEVNVEVVTPTAPGSQGRAPTRTPATAASVSQIGSLSSGLSARQRLAMRGR